MLPSDDTSTLSPNCPCQLEDWIPGQDLIEGIVYPVLTFGKQGKWKHVGNILEEGKAWRQQTMGAIMKLITTTSIEILGATDSIECKYFKFST